ncbi:hypothetical protein Dhaf_2543 [Desulfitobacterium hafniense DCB-2]|uniref:Prokaryotic membrane lipoprotein lipid attachment site profile n=3 Tax=Desulfitobacterium hafniense TaxID=49338 RepID=A0A098AZA9_DESHA|nr:hypothetical protein [Desulfitobacterium hafniense]ACL20570.1 hypothetical protein Dhaf_2543 [Desulfitobacterium hafniense DCB-2]EHL04373.1 hypothetical protein HMPREF0322_04883 [Desulfitobacterium hafniense DP7]CDX01452.1 Prokaryotic membrane lipoprotein lipid attachment site profile [Desulfitobacterium hafniense]
MNKLTKTAGIVALGLSLILTGCSAFPGQSKGDPQPVDQAGSKEPDSADLTDQQKSKAREKIESALNANQEIFQITWSPDQEQVLYIQPGGASKKGLDEAYLWQIGKEEARFVRDVQPTVRSLSWSPDSKHFIISEKLAEGAINSIVNAETLQESPFKPKSMDTPVWKPDSTAIAYGNEFHEYGETWGFLEIYTLGDQDSDYLWKAKDTYYRVESWDQEGNINYTEEDIPGQKTQKKSTQNIRPSISGVHLGDTREQVMAALGKNYQETAPSGETGHFPEPVYRWDYEGIKVFIGADSGKVLEINATSPQAVTDLGVKVGDKAEKVFAAYRSKYVEPESIHGGTLYGIFKVEGAAALAFNFDTDPAQYPRQIKPDHKVTGMVLTYPEIMDDSF